MDYSANAIMAAVATILVVLALEDWAYLQTKSKLYRAIITGVGVFMVVLLLNIPLVYW